MIFFICSTVFSMLALVSFSTSVHTDYNSSLTYTLLPLSFSSFIVMHSTHHQQCTHPQGQHTPPPHLLFKTLTPSLHECIVHIKYHDKCVYQCVQGEFPAHQNSWEQCYPLHFGSETNSDDVSTLQKHECLWECVCVCAHVCVPSSVLCVPATILSGRFITLVLRKSSEASSEITTSVRKESYDLKLPVCLSAVCLPVRLVKASSYLA